jgi:hypothetical protein
MTVVELFAKLGLKVDDASFKKGESAIGGMRTMLGAVGLSVSAVRGAVEALVASTAEHGNAAEKAAQRVGVSVQALQELTEAADDVQIASGAVESGLRFVGKNAYEAAHGNKEAAKGFNTLGISVKDASGKLKTADVLMMELADGFAGVADADKPALAMKLFGKAGGELIPLLNKGSEGIAEMRAEAVSLGLVMDADGVAASVAYTQALDGLEDSLKGLKLSIGGSLLKGSTEMLNTMAAWVRENRILIATRVKEFVDRLGAAISKVKKILDPFISAVKWLISQTWLWKIALGVVIAMLAIQFGAAVQAAVKGLQKMLVTVRAITASQVLGAAAAAATALLWAAGIALVLLAIEELYGWFTGDRETLLGRWLGSFDEFAEKNAFGRMLKSWIETLKELKGFMEDDNTFTNWVRGTVASGQYVGAAMASPFSERAREARKGYGKEAGYFFGREFLTPQGQAAMGAPTSYPGSTSSGGGVKVQIGDVHVGAALPDGLSPGEFVRRLGSEIVTQSDLQNMFNVTHEAVAR